MSKIGRRQLTEKFQCATCKKLFIKRKLKPRVNVSKMSSVSRSSNASFERMVKIASILSKRHSSELQTNNTERQISKECKRISRKKLARITKRRQTKTLKTRKQKRIRKTPKILKKKPSDAPKLLTAAWEMKTCEENINKPPSTRSAGILSEFNPTSEMMTCYQQDIKVTEKCSFYPLDCISSRFLVKPKLIKFTMQSQRRHQPKAKLSNIKLKKVIKKNKRLKQSINYSKQIRELMQRTHPDLSLSYRSMEIFNEILNDLCQKVANEASILLKHTNRKTMRKNDVQTAVKLLMPKKLHDIPNENNNILCSAN